MQTLAYHYSIVLFLSFFAFEEKIIEVKMIIKIRLNEKQIYHNHSYVKNTWGTNQWKYKNKLIMAKHVK
jgi:hypothetical protein